MFGGEVDIAAHIGVVGRVFARRFGRGIVCFAKYNRWELLLVGPIALARNHLPPNAYVLNRAYPRRVGVLTGVVKVKNKV